MINDANQQYKMSQRTCNRKSTYKKDEVLALLLESDDDDVNDDTDDDDDDDYESEETGDEITADDSDSEGSVTVTFL